MQLMNVGLYVVKSGLPIVGIAETGKLYKPMQFIIKFTVNDNSTSQRIILQQVVTPYVGGHYTPMRGFTYLVNKKKAVGIQRSIANIDNVDSEVKLLVEEANRFMYMYCHTDVI
jgi:hypothetical protein